MSYNTIKYIFAIGSRLLFRIRTWVFLGSVMLCCILFIIALLVNACQYRRGQQVIIDNQLEQIARFDSITQKYEEDFTSTLVEKERMVHKMLSDSAIQETPDLCDKQKNTIINFIKPCWEETTRELTREEKIKGWLEQTPAQNTQLLQDVKSLLELQYAKLQYEYEALEIWAALLTIVFLIFSFYSLFKSERFEEQSRGLVKDIHHQKEKAEKHICDINDRSNKMLERTERKLDNSRKEIYRSVKRIIDGANQQIEQFKDATERTFGDNYIRMENMRKEYEMELKQNLDKINQQMDNSLEQLNQIMDDARELLDKLGTVENK